MYVCVSLSMNDAGRKYSLYCEFISNHRATLTVVADIVCVLMRGVLHMCLCMCVCRDR